MMQLLGYGRLYDFHGVYEGLWKDYIGFIRFRQGL